MRNQVLEGTVLDRDVVIRRATLTVDESKVTRDKQTSFTLKVGDREVHVEIDDKTQICGRKRAKGSWSEIEKLDIAKAFDVEPAPDATVSIDYVEIKNGDSVAVYGPVEMQRESAGYRAESKEFVRSIKALVVASGEDGRSELDERVAKDTPRPPKKRTPWAVFFAYAAILFGVAVIVGACSLIDDLPWALDVSVFGAGHAIIGIVFVWRLSPKYVFFEKSRGWSGAAAFGLYVGGLIFSLPPLFDNPGRMDDGKRIYTAPLGFFAWSATLAILTVFVLRWEWRTLATTRRLLSARGHSSPPKDGEWGVSEGVVEEATLKVGQTGAALVSIFEEEYVAGSNPNREIHTLRDAPFVLVRSDGERVRVDPRGGFAGSVHHVLGHKTVTGDRKKAMRSTHFVPAGGTAMVLGRMKIEDGVPKMSAGLGADSLVIFSAPSLRWTLFKRLFTSAMLIALLVIGSLALATLLFYHPFLPPMYAPGD